MANLKVRIKSHIENLTIILHPFKLEKISTLTFYQK